MLESLKNLETNLPAIIDPKSMNLDYIGRFGQGLSTTSRNTSFLKAFQAKCQKVVQMYLPVPDPRPKLISFASLTEGGLSPESITLNSYSKISFFLGKELLYRVFNTENKLVRTILENSGFKYTESHIWNVLWIGKSAQAYLYEDLNPYQRINHFPNSFEITRKDKMCLNLMAMKAKFPNDYDFFPDTYIIPKVIGDFTLKFYEQDCQWIVKPCNSSQGKGIFILESLNALDLDGGCIVSKYIENPLLINNLKSDLRLYVLVSSFEPLKIYIYEEGLARFACEDYTADSSNKFIFLTNYSINKKSDKFIPNTDWQSDNIGHKWSFSAFLKEMAKLGYDTDLVIKRIYDLIIKTIISIENLVVDSVRKFALKHNNCFDIFGFDVLLDQELKPWLLEVNLCPSMNTDAPLDLYIKSNLIADAFNLIGIRAFDRKKESVSKINTRIKARQNGLKRKTEGKRLEGKIRMDDPKYKSLFLETLEETLRLGHFVRIYPFFGGEDYEKFFKTPRKVNKVLYGFLFGEVLKNEAVMPGMPGMSPSLTEDDIIQEYISRVLREYKALGDKVSEDLRWKLESLADFLIPGQDPQVLRLQRYLSHQLSISKFKGEKTSLMKTFTSGQLENMIKSTNKEIIHYLFDGAGHGILTSIINLPNTLSAKTKSFRFLKVKTLGNTPRSASTIFRNISSPGLPLESSFTRTFDGK
ncbi:hypothetical protein SteCoe_8649 [Stentor coeruleus]|uniref:Tubulin--tyrosine ligase-like protein 9 n=1 Tax=Stentor coeruleus TaxID=5963 RepID=A0A1R2CJU1_9CILI|nr:hypothetical protein SteCoe_8649 [Stentor coeruleus]